MSERTRVAAAWAIALTADFLQAVLFPLTFAGGLNPINAGVDVVVGALLTYLLGWHWAFLPSFLGELVPLVDIVPFWSLAMLLATRARRARLETPLPPVVVGEARPTPHALPNR